MFQKKPKKHDHIVAVGELEGQTIQVLVPPTNPDKFMYRLVKKQGMDITMSNTLFDSLEAAFEAAVKAIIPDAIPVAFVTPGHEDFAVLNAMLWGLQDGARLETFQEAFDMYQLLMKAEEAMRKALEKMPVDYDHCIDMLDSINHGGTYASQVLRSLRDIAIKSLQGELTMCVRDLETLRGFIQAFTSL